MAPLSPEDLRLLIEGGEDVAVEFKSRLPPDEQIARNLAAFANTSGGVFIIGVSDSGQVVGLSREEAERAKVRISRIAESIMPGRVTQVGSITISGRLVVFAEVRKPTSDEPPVVTATGEFFQRENARTIRNNVVLTDYIRSALQQQPSSKDSEIAVFVAMSFRNEEEPALVDYYKAMERAAERSETEIRLWRIDLVEGDYEISQEIMNQIDIADAVLADFTLGPPNVYFEIGYARGKEKQIIQTARMGTSLEFDVRNWKTLFYKNATELEELLVRAFDALGGNTKTVA